MCLFVRLISHLRWPLSAITSEIFVISPPVFSFPSLLAPYPSGSIEASRIRSSMIRGGQCVAKIDPVVDCVSSGFCLGKALFVCITTIPFIRSPSIRASMG